MESSFVSALDARLASLNNMFLEREEDAVIRLDCLQHEVKSCGADLESRRSLHKRLVDMHGEVLLLAHWSVLAYTATVKILKKHHKRTGLLLRAPHLENLLSQPFCSTEIMTQLASKAEESIKELGGSVLGPGLDSASSGEDNAGPDSHHHSRGSIERSGASTVVPGRHLPQRSSSTMMALPGSCRAGSGTRQGLGVAPPGSGGFEESEGCAGIGSAAACGSNLQHGHSTSLPRPKCCVPFPQRPCAAACEGGLHHSHSSSLPQEVSREVLQGSSHNRSVGAGLRRCRSSSLPQEVRQQQQQEVNNNGMGPAASTQGQGQEAGSLQHCGEFMTRSQAEQGGVKRSRAEHGVGERDEVKRGRAEWDGEDPGVRSDAKRNRAGWSEAPWSGEAAAEPDLQAERGQWEEQQQQLPQGLGVLHRTQVALSTWSQLKTGASTPSTVLNVPTLDPHRPSQNWSGTMMNGGEGGAGSDSCSARGPAKSAGRTSESSHD
ncbi:hypothetical protein DUNSADRAFT_1064 [Dunaliella salina]|uniref:SPX domain-containing protein n=1 Tax=Dunaliella salina TaxID=3046 RepID=A0ABQ7FXZ7_DUNSA|nr:hypothetical protein DUNSADRAFT_1064 [Dunaliella salina]|eukprot:KAF5827250.1 hypothetical protein DUNSADRAFT_1064 [Dunaliella salina]